MSRAVVYGAATMVLCGVAAGCGAVQHYERSAVPVLAAVGTQSGTAALVELGEGDALDLARVGGDRSRPRVTILVVRPACALVVTHLDASVVPRAFTFSSLVIGSGPLARRRAQFYGRMLRNSVRAGRCRRLVTAR